MADKGAAGTEEDEGDKEAEGDDGADEGEVAEGADRIDVAAINIVIWLEHHGNRLHGVMGLLIKKSAWSG